ncbi:dihydrolipoamide acetyltransferase family protein [Frigidibacter sp. MR17.24]|uniref:dihydrolipoamide acetyltransferase family protein n=1 Tax=Frigidibacter sp. MR17.24 TaxID=3127345 RepID=UPI003012A436
MGILSIRLPDIGEGIAEAELVEWLVAEGEVIREDAPMAAVMTDKATVEIPSPATGKVVWLGGAPGRMMAVGAELIRLEVEGPGNMKPAAPDTAPDAAKAATDPPAATKAATKAGPEADTEADSEADAGPGPAAEPRPDAASRAPARETATGKASAGSGRAVPAPRGGSGRPLAAPSVRARAREAGVDLRQLRGTGPAGRITRGDLDEWLAGGAPAPRSAPADGAVEEIPVIGLRRRIAERMAQAKREIPHITIVEEVDMQALEDLRARLNAEAGERLTLLPFLMKAIVRAVQAQPGLNAHYDAEAGVIRRFGAVHAGIATQTPGGLMVPVVRHVEALGLRESAAELARVTAAAREGRATRDELTGSTITVTSLGPLGAIASTPIINRPEVAIVGVNRMAVRPFWTGTAFEPRKMMNLSCSFDHRVIDGWDAAVFVQKLKTLLEAPALIFVDG